MSQDGFSHLDAQGRASMVDVAQKPVTARLAVARATVHMSAHTLASLNDPQRPKGDVLQVARLAGIMATKRTDELIPLCHSLGLDHAGVRFGLVEDGLVIECEASCQGRTGVEMEAMVGASLAALTVYDMIKAVDKQAWIGEVYVLVKEGGRSGRFEHPSPPQGTPIQWL